NSGKLQSKIMRDCENIELLLADGYRNLLMIFLSITIAITVTATKSPIVILFFVAVVPMEILLLRLLRGNIRRRNNKFRQEIEVTQSGVSEMIELIPVTRAHGLQKREVNKMNSRLDSVMTAGYRLDKTNSLFGASTWVLSEISRLSCLFFTGYLAYKGKISVGEVVLYQTYFSQIVNNISSLLNLYPRLTKGVESIHSISEVFYEKRVETDNAIIPLENMQGKVEFCDVCYRYPDSDKWVLENFSLTVQAGESIAFVGASGAGKTTLLDLLIGFDRPQDGQILIDRVNMINLDMTKYRNQIAVVPQNTILFAGTIRDNITYGLDNASDEEVLNVLKSVGLDDLLETLPEGIYTHLGEHGGKLSGGQRQRISIARALLRKPKMIIFDEATSALDSASEKKVQAAVDAMMQQCTTFMVAHRLSTIRNVDRIVVLEHGQVIEEGSYDELMAKQGAFYNLKKLQE
ncbi:MAG: ABC transporter ATP-binding protein, partial [Clostridia bacterium]|nr:ABC transporter ATP-binding protein [Clostridia bacterium]